MLNELNKLTLQFSGMVLKMWKVGLSNTNMKIPSLQLKNVDITSWI